MVPGTTEVQNELTPEEKPILENILTLVQQLNAMQGASAAQEKPEEMIVEEAYDTGDDKEVEKSVTGETGDDKAEHRLEEGTEITESSMQDLKKSIDALTLALSGKRAVAKSQTQPKPQNNLQSVLSQLTTVVKSLANKQDEQEKLNKNMFEALGFTEDVIQKSLPKKEKPIQNVDSNQMATAMVQEFMKTIAASNSGNGNKLQADNHPFNQKREARKDLSKVAEFLHKSTMTGAKQ